MRSIGWFRGGGCGGAGLKSGAVFTGRRTGGRNRTMSLGAGKIGGEGRNAK